MPRKPQLDQAGDEPTNEASSRDTSRRDFLAAGGAAVAAVTLSSVGLSRLVHAAELQLKFKRIPTQFIAALGDPKATSGNNAETWGIWTRDPGPRGVRLDSFGELKAAGGIAPARWKFDNSDWWLEEHGLIMEAPEFPVPVGRYLVTGNRQTTAMLTVHDKGSDGRQRWELNDRATLYDVTHLGCRSARYTPLTSGGSCSPAKARQSDFPVSPGAAMPPVESCHKQDYSVLIVIGVPLEA